MMLKRILLLLCAGLLLATGAVAQDAGSPYFQNIPLTPIGSADRSIATDEPAAVMVFTGEAGSADATALFNTWANSTTRKFHGSAFGVAQSSAGLPKEVLEEVLTQRELKFPVFMTDTDLLNGRQYRLMVIAGGRSFDVPGLDFAALERELARHSGAAAPAATATPIPTPAAAVVSPTPTPEAVVTPTPTPVAATPVVTAAVATPTPTPAATPAGASPGGKYFNTRYGFTLQFPDGWTYREARNGDGAVGRPAAEGHIDLRAWASPNTQGPQGQEGQMDLGQYVEEHLRLLSEQSGSRVGVLQRFKVDDEGTPGLDYLYSFSRAADQVAGAAPGQRVLFRGHIQVFLRDGVFKVVSAEAPVAEFDRSGAMIGNFIQSFHPFIADEQGNPVPEQPTGAGAAAGAPTPVPL